MPDYSTSCDHGDRNKNVYEIIVKNAIFSFFMFLFGDIASPNFQKNINLSQMDSLWLKYWCKL